ncbi:hypothetical protein ACPCTO_24870 [Streptomyces olivoreticuli]
MPESAVPRATEERESRRLMCPSGGEDIENDPTDPNFFRCERHGVTLLIKPQSPSYVPSASRDHLVRIRHLAP